MNADRPARPADLADAIDRYGADFNRWPDPALAAAGRRAVLADPSVRSARDDALALARGLSDTRAALDAGIVSDGASQRVRAAVLAGIRWRDRAPRFHWGAIAATLLVAAGLGGVFDIAVLSPQKQASYEIVNLDPLGVGVAEDASR